MRKIIYYIALVLLISSCEKVVNIDLNEANPKIIVDAMVVDTGNGLGNAVVRLSWSSSFYEDNSFTPINDAIIHITDPRGKKYSFDEFPKGSGVYLNTTLYPTYLDDKFTLDIEAAGEKLSAVTTLPRFVKIDSLTIAPFTFGPHGGNGFVVQCHWMDPPNEKNYYYLKLIINDTAQTDYFIGSDDAIDGKQIDYVFFQHSITNGAFVVVQLYTIDKAAYDYFRVLQQDESSGGMSAAPGNPVSNIQGNAFGLFRASAMDQAYIIVPPFSH